MAMDGDDIRKLRSLAGTWEQGHINDYIGHDWNLHRWIVAYEGKVEEAAAVLRRHLNIRDVMGLSSLPEDEPPCSLMEAHAPIDILGRNRPDDNKVTLWEMTGALDIHGLVDNIRISPFMRSRFRWMEKVHREVVATERETGRQSGGLLVMDLGGLRFSPSLLSILAGPYRIMWGTLFEQYPQMIQQIVIVNAPTFVNVLYSTCMPFIPSDYKSKITICSSSSPSSTLLQHLHPSTLPRHYLDDSSSSPSISIPSSPFPKAESLGVELESLTIPAGGRVYLKLRLEAGEALNIYTKHESELSCFWFYSATDTKEEGEWREIIAGCERPALSTVDHLRWEVPLDGFYFVRYGNEKAWFLSVVVKYRYESEQRGKILPIEQFTA